MKPAELTASIPQPPELDQYDYPAAPTSASRDVKSSSAAPAEVVGQTKPALPPKADAPQPQHVVGWWERLMHRTEARISRLSTRNNFWHRVCSWIWLPLAFRSGIKIHTGSVGTFSAILPFRRFNRNWYSAMAGAALLANSEVAGGMFVFGKCGAKYTVVCKRLEYDFLRPCVGPAVYQIEPRQNIDELLRTKDEFNITLDMNIVQMVSPKQQRERRVGRCVGQFHVAPKTQHHQRKRSQRN